MCTSSIKNLLICNNEGVLFQYTKILNALGLFRITPCTSYGEARDLISDNRRFDYLFYDGFGGVDSELRDLLIFSKNVANIVVFAEFDEAQRSDILRWAQQNDISFMGILPRPVQTHHIHQLITHREESKASVENTEGSYADCSVR